jgi:ribonuclease HI
MWRKLRFLNNNNNNMRKVFIATRAHHEKKQNRGGIASTLLSFFGLKEHSRAIDIADKQALALIALKEGLEKLAEIELQPYHLQIDSDAVGLVMKFYNNTISEEELALYRPYLNQIRDTLPKTGITFEFKKAKDYAGQSIVHKAEINAQCEIQDFSLGLDNIASPTPEQDN